MERDEANEMLDKLIEDSGGAWVDIRNSETVVLDGAFTPTELERIVLIMKAWLYVNTSKTS